MCQMQSLLIFSVRPSISCFGFSVFLLFSFSVCRSLLWYFSSSAIELPKIDFIFMKKVLNTNSQAYHLNWKKRNNFRSRGWPVTHWEEDFADWFHNLESSRIFSLPAELVRRVNILIYRLGTHWLGYICIYSSWVIAAMQITLLFTLLSHPGYYWRSRRCRRSWANRRIGQ